MTTDLASPVVSTLVRRAIVRIGRIPENERMMLVGDESYARGTPVVVESPRGLLLGEVLDVLKPAPATEEDSALPTVLRVATAADLERHRALEQEAQGEFMDWMMRIGQWGLALDLLDLERTLDRSRLLIYVLSGRGPDCTKLALQSVAAGLGAVEVIPVNQSAEAPSSKGGCGTGGGGCGCGH